MKNMPDTFSIDFACLQISPFKAVILHSFLKRERRPEIRLQANSFWAILPNKIGKHSQVKHFPNRSAKHARFTTD